MFTHLHKLAISTFLLLSVFSSNAQTDIIPGYALELSSGSYIDLDTPSFGSLGSNPFTVEAWIKTTSSGVRQQILSFGSSYTNEGCWFFIDDNNRLAVDLSNVAGTTSITTVTDDMWHHVAVVCRTPDVIISPNDMEFLLYVDGIQTGSVVTLQPAITNSNIDHACIGAPLTAQSWQPWYFNGKIDELRVWDIALDTNQLRARMHQMLTGTEPNLVSYYQFNSEAAGVISEPIQNNTGTLINGALLANSTVPAGGQSTGVIQRIKTGLHTYANAEIELIDNFDDTTDLTINAIHNIPANPTNVNTYYKDNYWVIHAYGNSGVFSCNLKITMPNGYLNTSDTAVLLFWRKSNSDTTWTIIDTANIGDITDTTVLFHNVSVLGQFMIGSNGSSLLPVEIISFDAHNSSENILINWSTASEIQSKGFDVERSSDGEHFKSIQFVYSKSAYSTQVSNYSITDINPFKEQTPKFYYRLKMVDIDGQEKYSKTISVSNTKREASFITTNPNPFSDVLYVNLTSNSTNEMVQFNLYDITGRIIAKA
jgi:hypothetical protein